MELTISERISIGVICPEKDNIDRLLLRKSIIKKTEIGIEEGNEIEIKQVGNQLTWNDKAKDKEIEFSESESNYLREVIKELSTKKELHFTMVDLHQKLTK